MSCTCHRLAVGLEPTDSYDWSPGCEEHGVRSAWYNVPQRRRERWAHKVQLVELQLKAAIARGVDEAGLDSIESYLERLREEEPEG